MTRRALTGLAPALALALAAGAAAAEDFSYLPPGDLISGSGEGRADDVNYAPGMQFPIEEGPAFANSQVYNPGGYLGPPGGQCAAVNYDYPWRDNYCETRQYSMPLCPAGTGHQGQDIRPATCEAGVHWAVAAVDGTITSIGSYSVYLTGADGTRYDYLHMSDVQVAVGQDVARGQRIGKVSNEFGGTPTTIHLHFNLRQNVDGVGTVYVPPYASLVAAYEALVGLPLEGWLDAAACDGIRGWTRDPDAPDEPATALLVFDGELGAGEAEAHAIVANQHREDLCAALGSCAHGFSAGVPLALLGGGERQVRAYGRAPGGGAEIELEGSPQTFDCPLVLPDGVRRRVQGAASQEAWRFSPFWDIARADDTAIEALPPGDDLPAAPELLSADDGSGALWLLDRGLRRLVPGPEAAAAWDLDPAAAAIRPAAEIDALPEGPPLRPRPFVVQGSSPALYLIDDPWGAGEGPDGDDDSNDRGVAGVEADAAASCTCRTVGAGGAAPSGLLVAAAAAARLRRRRLTG